MPDPGLEEEHTDVTPENLAWQMKRIDERRRNQQDWRLLFESVYLLWGGEMGMRNGGSGAYGVIDKDGNHYTFFDSTRLVKSSDGNEIDAPLRPVRRADILEGLPEDVAEGIDRILGISMTYDGHLVVAATGALFVYDRDLNRKDTLFFPGEHIENSIAIDKKRIYLVDVVAHAWRRLGRRAALGRGGQRCLEEPLRRHA